MSPRRTSEIDHTTRAQRSGQAAARKSLRGSSRGGSSQRCYTRHEPGSDASVYARDYAGRSERSGISGRASNISGRVSGEDGGFDDGGFDGADFSGISSTDGHTRTSTSGHSRTSAAAHSRTGAASYSREAMRDAYSQKARASRIKRIILTLAICIPLCVLLVAGVAAGLFIHKMNSNLNDNVDQGTMSALADSSDKEPFYVLIMGVDRSEDRESSGEYGVYRSDTMILARIDPPNKQVTLISIERDTLVEITYTDSEGNQVTIQDKINAAHAIGGPQLTIETVSAFAGVPISHFVEVDFDGFTAIVDALGGVTVDVPITIDDPEAGGYIEAGEQTLTGEQALVLCRSRHAYDSVGGGDYYRAANQRMVIGACLEQLLKSDPATMLNTVSALCEYVTTDMNATDIASLALAFVGMDASTGIYSSMNPTYSYYDGASWWEYSNNQAWQAMMQRVDAGQSPTINEADSANRGGVTDGTINPEYVAQSVLTDTSGSSPAEADTWTVTVLNGSGVPGAAATGAEVLRQDGWTVNDDNIGNADTTDYANTTIVYGALGDSDYAQQIAELLGVGVVMPDDGTYSFDTAYLVIMGKDY